MSPLVKFIFWVAVLFPTIGYCGDAALAIGSGVVKLNGKVLVRSSAVFPGDELKTEADSAVVLHAKGSTVQVGPRTVFEVRSGGLALASGSARVTGKLSLVAADVTVNADLQSTSYVVARGDRVVIVTAIRSPIQVQVGKRKVIVRGGETRSFSDDGITFPPVGPNRNKRSAAVGFASGAGVGAVIASHLNDGGAGDVSNGRIGR